MEKKLAEEWGGQRPFANALAKNLDRLERFWMEYRHLDKLRLLNPKRTLDVGCGLATGLHLLKGELHGIDPLMDHYQTVYQYPEELILTNTFAETIPYPDAHFDLVLCTNVLDHVSDPKKVVSEIHRVLAPSGTFFLLIEYYDVDIRRDEAHPFSFRQKDIKALLRDFWPIYWEARSWVPGIMEYVDCRIPRAEHKTVTAFLKGVR